MAIKIVMVLAAERNGELVADLAAKGSWLRELQVVGIARGALADQAGLCRDECQMGLVSPSPLLAQRRDPGFGVLVLGGRCNGRRLSSPAVSVRWRNRRGFGWVLLKLLRYEIQRLEHDLTSVLDGARSGRSHRFIDLQSART